MAVVIAEAVEEVVAIAVAAEEVQGEATVHLEALTAHQEALIAHLEALTVAQDPQAVDQDPPEVAQQDRT